MTVASGSPGSPGRRCVPGTLRRVRLAMRYGARRSRVSFVAGNVLIPRRVGQRWSNRRRRRGRHGRLVPLGIQAMAPHETIYRSLLAYLHAEGFADSSADTLAGNLDLSAAFGLLIVQLSSTSPSRSPGHAMPLCQRHERASGAPTKRHGSASTNRVIAEARR